MNPITIEEANEGNRLDKNPGLIDSAVKYINDHIAARAWHDQIVEVDGYYAILISPFGAFHGVKEATEKRFKAAGWDCMFKDAYDARGPHECFYVNKKHFK